MLQRDTHDVIVVKYFHTEIKKFQVHQRDESCLPTNIFFIVYIFLMLPLKSENPLLFTFDVSLNQPYCLTNRRKHISLCEKDDIVSTNDVPLCCWYIDVHGKGKYLN